MPDWKPEIRSRLAGLHLAEMREAAIVGELAQYLDDHYSECSQAARVKRKPIAKRSPNCAAVSC